MPRQSSPQPRDGASDVGGALLRHGTETVNGVRLHYLTADVVKGEGAARAPVVLLHGWPVTSYTWRKVLPTLAAAGHPVLAPDLRGLGDSEKPAGRAAASDGYDKRAVAEDVLQLAERLGFGAFHLVGHDIGAWAAFALALGRPARVRRLVLAESLLPGFGLEERMDVSAGGYWHFGFHMAENIPEMLTAGREREYLSAMAYRAKPRPSAMADGDVAEYVRCYAAPGGMRAAFGHYRTVLADGKHNNEAVTRGARLPMPVLVLGGEHSAIPRGELVKGVSKVAADVRDGGAVPDSGHFLSEDNPAELSRRLLAFFGDER